MHAEREKAVEDEDKALKGTEKAGTLWSIVYVLAALGFLRRMFDLWFACHELPFRWRAPIDSGFDMLFLPLPLLVGMAFRGLLKKELGKDLLSPRTYEICEYWVALLLLVVYMGMMSYGH
jgi:hypothetical protein